MVEKHLKHIFGCNWRLSSNGVVVKFRFYTFEGRYLRPVYTKRQWLIWSLSINACVISDQMEFATHFWSNSLGLLRNIPTASCYGIIATYEAMRHAGLTFTEFNQNDIACDTAL